MFGLTAEAREAGAGRLELFTGGQEAAGQGRPEQNQNFECQEERGDRNTMSGGEERGDRTRAEPQF